MTRWQLFQAFIEYLGGARDENPSRLPIPIPSVFWGILWVVLLGFIVLFSGQSSKFIYIDF